MIKKNIIANYLGQGWSAAMGFAFIPVYIEYLGMEAYGLIGLYAVIYALLGLLDMGMTPTLNREMARYTAGAHTAQSIGDLLWSLEIIVFGMAVLIALVLCVVSDLIAGNWLNVGQIPVDTAAQALAIIALVVALRFCESIYRGTLFGLQRQVWYNSTFAVFSTMRHGGAVAILAWVSPTIVAFFVWHALVSVIALPVFARKVHKLLPKAPLPVKFSRKAISEVWKFAGGMICITLLTLLLTQVDKILLSHLLPLEEFGYYVLAATVAGALYMITGPISQAIYPRMVELSTLGEQTGLIAVYHLGAQLVTVMIAPAVMLFSFFAEEVIFMWSGNSELATNTAPILSVLVLGSFLNGLMWMPTQCQLAYGWTSLILKVNVIAVVVFIPALFWIVPVYGAVGTAWLWVALNAGYVLITAHFMHRRLIPNEKWRWYFEDIILPSIGAVGVVLIAHTFYTEGYEGRLQWFAFFLVVGCTSLVVSIGFSNRLRAYVMAVMVRTFFWLPR